MIDQVVIKPGSTIAGPTTFRWHWQRRRGRPQRSRGEPDRPGCAPHTAGASACPSSQRHSCRWTWPRGTRRRRAAPRWSGPKWLACIRRGRRRASSSRRVASGCRCLWCPGAAFCFPRPCPFLHTSGTGWFCRPHWMEKEKMIKPFFHPPIKNYFFWLFFRWIMFN